MLIIIICSTYMSLKFSKAIRDNANIIHEYMQKNDW